MSLSNSSVTCLGVILLGLGQVGSCVLNQLHKAKSFHQTKHNVSFDILAVSDSTGAVFQHQAQHAHPKYLTCQPLSEQLWKETIAWKVEKKAKLENFQGAQKTTPEQVVESLAGPHTIVVDCSGSELTTSALLLALSKGSGVVLANKKPLTLAQSIYNQFTNAHNLPRMKNESTVGAGTPMIAVTNRIVNSGDNIKKIQGTFSGTLGYVMTGLEQGQSYSAVVAEAIAKGYTEPDPRDDLGGVDVARKALILARSLGIEIEMSDLLIEPLYSAKMAGFTVDEFKANLHMMDDEFKQRVLTAQQENKVLRYVALIEVIEEANQSKKAKIKVGLQALDRNTPIGKLQGTENMLELYTDLYGSKPLVVQGAGAGGAITAAGIIADMIDLAPILTKMQ